MKRYVAFLDILGFSQLLEKNELSKVEQIFDKCLKNLHSLEYSGDCTIQSGVEVKFLKEDLTFVIISDSIIIYTKNDMRESLNVLISTCKNLLNSCLKNGIPLRGAISVGDFKEIHMPHFSGLSIIGNAVTNSYKLEKEQNWMGCVIDYRCFEHLNIHIVDRIEENNTPYVFNLDKIEYDNTPYKLGSKKAVVINWANTFDKNNIEDIEKMLYKNFSLHNKEIDDSVKEKIKNTLLFFEYVKKNDLFIKSYLEV